MPPLAPPTASKFSRTCKTFVTAAPCPNDCIGALGLPAGLQAMLQVFGYM